jgi:Fe-S-cluster-containing hydrogenase component 2
MKMELIQMDQGLCIRCGNCAAVCTKGIINMGKEGAEYSFPVVDGTCSFDKDTKGGANGYTS